VPESLLTILKLFLLVLLYLFFFRVLRAVWAEITPSRAVAEAPARRSRRERRPPRSRSAEPRLVVVEPDDQRGRAFDLASEMTVGRAAGCQVVLDDTYVSQLHTRIFQRDGQVMVEDLGSTNGTYLNNRRVSGPMMMSRGDKLRVGKTVMELQ
jgi:pSer/pThr/pTyr-binding forkhead associated (FHA) protein